MGLFRREYKLIFGTAGGPGSEITDLQITFKIVKTADATKNKCTISVYNLSPETRALLEIDKDEKGEGKDPSNPVILLQTQYAEDVTDSQALRGFQTLFTGNVINAITSKKGGDMITEIEASDGYVALREGVIAKNFPPGTNRLQVLNALIAELGVDAGEIQDGGALTASVFENGTTFEGPIKLILDSLMEPIFCDWSIQDGALTVVRKDLTSGETILDISSSSGLIGSPQAKKGRANKTTDSKNESGSGVKIKTLLSPSILPNRRIKVTSLQYATGQVFKVTRVRHVGNFRGKNWTTEAELIESS